MTLSACKDDTSLCSDGQIWNDQTDECEEVPLVCDDGYVLNEETNECDRIVPNCEEGFVLNVETNECDPIIEVDPLEVAFANSQGMDNYQMDVTVTENNVTIHLILQFDGNVSSIQVNDTVEYFVQTGNVCSRITQQLGTVYEETVDCIAQDDTRFQFFHAFDLDWFDILGDHYMIAEGNYNALNNFFRTSIPGAVVSDFQLYLSEGYFSQFTFNINATESNYVFTIDFSNINELNIEVPNIE